MATVTLNGVRLDNADTNTGWGNFNASGPAPGAEPQLKYQGTNAVNKKITSTSSRQGVAYTHGTGQNMTTSHPLWIAKMKVGDAGDLNATYGCELAAGSSSGNYYSYNVSGSGANNDQYSAGYNSQGGLAEGYIVTAVNPSVSQWREGTTGTPDLTSVLFFGVAAQFVTGGAKSENVAQDAVDVATGLDYNGTLFSFEDGPDTDQDNTSNRWGLACRNGSVVALRGLHRIGTTSATSGTDESTVLFPDGYHGTGDAGIEYDTTNSTAVLNGAYTGLGRVYGADDTRPNLSFVGDDTNSSTHAPQLVNFNQLILRSSITFDGADVEIAEMTQASGTVQNSTIRCNSASGVAVCDDPNFTNLDGISFVQSGSGHALEITSTGTYSLDALSFSGFGADGTNSAAIYNNSGGLVTLNIINGGDTPTIRNGTGASTTVNNSVSITLNNLIAGSRVYIRDTTNSITLFNVIEATTTFTDTYDYAGDIDIFIRVRKSTSAPYYRTFENTGTVTTNGFTLNVNQISDE